MWFFSYLVYYRPNQGTKKGNVASSVKWRLVENVVLWLIKS